MRNPAEHHQAIDYPDVKPVYFDFADPACFDNALAGVAVLFLLRPLQLADVPRYFAPLIDAAKKLNVAHLVFLSVQGVDKNRFIPHHKIENLIRECGLPYTFLRPAYFMQNFTTTLLADIQHKQRVYLPAGKALFTLVDLRDVGAVAASIMLQPSAHRNKAYNLTSADQLDFASMTRVLSQATGQPISFKSPNLLSFFVQKRKEGLVPTLVGVLIMLHYLPRFKKHLPPATQ